MWQARASAIENGRHFELAEFGKPLAFRRFFELLAGDETFAGWYTERLAAFEAEAFYWELPPLTKNLLDCHSEFVLIDAPALAGISPDPLPFAAHFQRAPGNNVVTFDNLGGDAILVAPGPLGPAETYPHLAAFLRLGANTQIHALWRATVQALVRRIGARPVWLSTAGGGVNWLHMRLDDWPKYYSHTPYRESPG